MFIDTILNLLFPVSCIVCRTLVTERRWAAACPECWAQLMPITRPFCERCGTPAFAVDGDCGICRKEENHFDFARSAVFFTDTAREFVHHLKYLDRISMARPLGVMLGDLYRSEGFQAELIAPVPLHPRRQRERGFNQAEGIARHIGPRVHDKLIRRTRKTETQTGLTRSQRKENLAGAFSINGEVAGKRILIVDDVFTTGSTVNEIARILKQGGAERVEVLTVARVAGNQAIAAPGTSSVNSQ